MRKRIIGKGLKEWSYLEEGWLELERMAEIEITSEDAAHLIEAALLPGAEEGWRAAYPGAQTIRLLFAEPLRIGRIYLIFDEEERERTQEFTLRWSADCGRTYREIVCQQYNFSPPGTTREVEDFQVDLKGVTTLELRIVPDIGGADVYASLKELRLA